MRTTALERLPFAVAYNPFDRNMYVTNNAGTVFVINGTTNTLIGSLRVGGPSSGLYGIAYSPADHGMYVTSYSDDKVYILNGSQVSGSIDGFDAPIGISFSANGLEMFVVNSSNGTVSAWWDGDSSNVTVGPDPREVVFDPSLGAILVTNYGDATLTEISA